MKVDWIDDWPVFNDGKNIALLTQGRSLQQNVPGSTEEVPTWTADLSKTEIELGWYQKSTSLFTSCYSCPCVLSLRIDTPIKQSYSLTDRPGYLRIYGNCYDLSSPEAPAMLLRKQTAYDQTFETTMTFDPSRTGCEAGIVLWWNQYSYATIGMTRLELPGGERAPMVICRSPSGQAGVMSVSKQPDPSRPCASRSSRQQTEYPFLSPRNPLSGMETPLSQGPVRLTLRCSGATYNLELRQGASKASRTCRAEDLTVMPLLGGAFAGVMFGLYSFGKGEPVLDPADFTDIRVTNQVNP